MTAAAVAEGTGTRAWRGVARAFCTCLLGLGIARFSYTPLIPALIAAHWFTPSDTVFLGSANMAGYLAGGLAARAVARALGLPWALRLLMLMATTSLLACSVPSSFIWFCAWRLASGFAGAGLTVLAAPAVLPFVEARHRGLAAGVIFTGIGLGIAGSGSLLPVLMRAGPGPAWLALGGMGAVLTLLAWHGWPARLPARPAGHPAPMGWRLRALFVAYGLSAIGQVPGMLFLSDFVARGLGRGVAEGAHLWAVFGAGALAGPLAAGWLADRIGFPAALRLNWLAQIGACLLLWWAPGLAAVAAASVVIGAGIPGLVVLVLGRSQEMAREAAPRAWSLATICFAGGQVVGAYGLSFVFKQTGSYELLFASSVVAMAAALAAGEVSRRDG